MKKGGAFQRLLFSTVIRLVSFAFPIPLHHLHKQGSGGVEHMVFTASSLYARALSPSDFSHVPVFQKTHPLLRW